MVHLLEIRRALSLINRIHIVGDEELRAHINQEQNTAITRPEVCSFRTLSQPDLIKRECSMRSSCYVSIVADALANLSLITLLRMYRRGNNPS